MDEDDGPAEGHSPSQWISLFGMFAISFDFMCTFFVIPFFWVSLGGSLDVYGVIFGLYSISRAVGAPVTGYLGDRIGIKPTFAFCFVLMLIGNAMYFFSSGKTYKVSVDDESSAGIGPGNKFVIDTDAVERVDAGGRWLFIAARCVSGLGSSGMVMVNSFLIQSSSHDSRVFVMNRYRMAALLGSVAGAVVCSSTLYVPLDNSVLSPFKFDGTTIPVFVASGLEALALVLVVAVFNSAEFDKLPAYGVFRKENVPLVRNALVFNLFNGLLVFCMWLLFSEIIIISALEYQIVDSFSTLWKGYLPTMIGSVASMIILKPLVKRFKLNDRALVIFAPLVVAAGSVLLFSFFTDTPSAVLFYIGASVMFCGQGIYLSGFRAYYGAFVDTSEFTSTLTGWVFISGGLGAFLGSTLGSVILKPQIDSSECCNYTTYDCCNVGVHGMNILVTVIIVLSVGISAGQYFFLPHPNVTEAERDDDGNYRESSRLIN